MTSTPKNLERAREIVFDSPGIVCPVVPTCEKEAPCSCCEGAIKLIASALTQVEDEAYERAAKELDSIVEDYFNACSDNPELQLTWNSALRQAAYKAQGKAKAIRSLKSERREGGKV